MAGEDIRALKAVPNTFPPRLWLTAVTDIPNGGGEEESVWLFNGAWAKKVGQQGQHA